MLGFFIDRQFNDEGVNQGGVRCLRRADVDGHGEIFLLLCFG